MLVPIQRKSFWAGDIDQTLIFTQTHFFELLMHLRDLKKFPQPIWPVGPELSGWLCTCCRQCRADFGGVQSPASPEATPCWPFNISRKQVENHSDSMGRRSSKYKGRGLNLGHYAQKVYTYFSTEIRHLIIICSFRSKSRMLKNPSLWI